MKEELKPRFDQLCEQASKEQDPARLLELVRQINQMALDETADDPKAREEKRREEKRLLPNVVTFCSSVDKTAAML